MCETRDALQSSVFEAAQSNLERREKMEQLHDRTGRVEGYEGKLKELVITNKIQRQRTND
eukprot:TRINITY_DN9794_c0_g1_i1.p3 TRINITY_DN9794_c0_g1~~TRINITY_DN9794_c0_g1_i1.p3  ORF type:complete len:60 (-),score=7.17 TRINITY_DN9794_c0_g1_i1:193-372(-)